MNDDFVCMKSEIVDNNNGRIIAVGFSTQYWGEKRNPKSRDLQQIYELCVTSVLSMVIYNILRRECRCR